jgi:hypothetical protein
MVDFLFASWPGGLGPTIVQGVLAAAGAALGIRVIDDLKAWRATRVRLSSRS